ncbi:MAG: hypothetical protein MUC66_03305 [Methanolinea sp.]|nr:hypothetical protein [Methanolinea sp.]
MVWPGRAGGEERCGAAGGFSPAVSVSGLVVLVGVCGDMDVIPLAGMGGRCSAGVSAGSVTEGESLAL